MYAEPSAWPMAIATAAFGAIYIGIALMLAAGREARDPKGSAARVQRDGSLGVKLILGGLAGLAGLAVWRLF